MFILILFVDSVNRVYKVQAEHSSVLESHHHGGNIVASDRSEIQARRFYSQRNMYLCGFTLFLSLILNRTYGLVLELLAAEDTINQLKGTSDSSVKAEALSSESESEIERLKKELAQKDSDMETLKKQSKALSDEYMNISDKVNEKEGAGISDKKND